MLPSGPFLGAIRRPECAKPAFFSGFLKRMMGLEPTTLCMARTLMLPPSHQDRRGRPRRSLNMLGAIPASRPLGLGVVLRPWRQHASSNQAPRDRQGDTLKKDQRAVAPRWSPSPRNEPRIRYGTPRLKCFFPAAERRWSGRASLGSGGRCRAATRRQRCALSLGRA
jgi:hypothetical protein